MAFTDECEMRNPMTIAVPAVAAFVRAIAVLALDSDSQVAWLRSLGLPGEPYYADELAEEFHDGFVFLDEFVANAWLPPEIANSARQIHERLTSRAGPSHEVFWRVESLAGHPDWVAVRALAQSALNAIR
jgi:hypothetical protein